MGQISQASMITGGDVNILHPLELTRQIRLLSQNPVIATEVSVRLLVHPAIVFNQTEAENVGQIN